MEINEPKDLNVLYMALWAAKFPINEDKLVLLAGSKIVVDLLEKLMKELNIVEETNIEIVPEAVDHIKSCIASIPNFANLPLEVKKEGVKNMIFPFRYSESFLEKLID